MFNRNNNRPPELKSARELGLMREAGKLVAHALKICRDMAKPGTKTIDIDREVEAFYAKPRRHPACLRDTPARCRSRPAPA